MKRRDIIFNSLLGVLVLSVGLIASLVQNDEKFVFLGITMFNLFISIASLRFMLEGAEK